MFHLEPLGQLGHSIKVMGFNQVDTSCMLFYRYKKPLNYYWVHQKYQRGFLILVWGRTNVLIERGLFFKMFTGCFSSKNRWVTQIQLPMILQMILGMLLLRKVEKAVSLRKNHWPPLFLMAWTRGLWLLHNAASKTMLCVLESVVFPGGRGWGRCGAIILLHPARICFCSSWCLAKHYFLVFVMQDLWKQRSPLWSNA